MAHPTPHGAAQYGGCASARETDPTNDACAPLRCCGDAGQEKEGCNQGAGH